MPFARPLLLLLLCLCAASARASGVAFVEVPADSRGPTLHAAIWTPCASPSATIALGAVAIDGVKDCPIVGTHLPLVAISHGYGGSALGHRDTAETLADAGFVVAAIDHSEDNYRIRGGPDDRISALATRTTDISRLIDYMLAQWPEQARIDPKRVGFFGFSRGGYTGLVLIGAQPDFDLLGPAPSSPCTAAPQVERCAQARQRFRDLLSTPLVHDARIRAAVIADPLAQVFTTQGLAHIDVPVQLWSSAYGGDGVTPDAVAALARNLPVAPEQHLVPNSAHFAFLAPCSPAQAQAHADICRDATGFDRVAFHADFDAQVLAFFRRWLEVKPGQGRQ